MNKGERAFDIEAPMGRPLESGKGRIWRREAVSKGEYGEEKLLIHKTPRTKSERKNKAAKVYVV